MSLSNKEKRIKDLLEDIPAQIDTNEVWASVEGRLPKRKKRIIPFWLFALLPFIAVLGYWFMQSQEEPAPEFSQEMMAEIETPPGSDVQTEQNINNEAINADKIESNSTIKIQDSYTEVHTQDQFTNQYDPSQSVIVLDRNPSGIEVNNKASNNYKNSTIRNPSTIVNQKKESTINATNNKESAKTNVTTLLLDRLPSIAVAELISEYQLPKFILRSYPTLVEKSTQWKTALSIRMGANRGISSYKTTEDDLALNAGDFARETDLYGHNTEIYIDAYNKAGWTIGTGISYSRTTARYINTDQETYQVEDDFLLQTNIRDNDIHWHRIHRGVDIRMKVSKSLFRFNALQVEPEIGLGYNLWSSSEGYYFDNTAFGFTAFEGNETSPYREKTGWNTQLGLSLLWQVQKWNIGLVPYFRYNPNNITNKTNFYHLKNSQVGLHISVAYKPNWE